MVIKNYSITGGFSDYIAEAEDGESYEIKGLMGKGLGLQKHGTHVAFVGGTGILTFIDLVSLLVRVNLGIIDAGDMPIFGKGSTFKFVLYASFRNRRDSIGLQFIEDFDKLCKAKGFDNFKLILRISDEGNGGRWDDAFIKQQISTLKRDSLTRIYVCGPPIMNEIFDHSLERLINKGTIRRNEVEIM